MPIITFSHQKGGVGKSTLAFNVAKKYMNQQMFVLLIMVNRVVYHRYQIWCILTS